MSKKKVSENSRNKKVKPGDKLRKPVTPGGCVLAAAKVRDWNTKMQLSGRRAVGKRLWPGKVELNHT